MMVSHTETEVEGDEYNLKVSQTSTLGLKGANSFKFKLLPQNFSTDQHLAITRVIVELTDSSGGSCLSKKAM